MLVLSTTGFLEGAKSVMNPNKNAGLGSAMALTVLVLLCTLQPKAEPDKIPFVVVDDLKAAGDETSVAEAQAYSQFARDQMTFQGEFLTLERSAIESLLKAKNFQLPCFDLDCYVAMGRVLKADQILTGNLERTGQRIEMTLRLIDIKKRTILNSVLREKDPCTVEDLLGNWGREVLADALQIPIEKLGEPIPEPEATPTPTPNIVEVLEEQFPGLVYIKPGRFTIGTNDGEFVEAPARTVYTTAFLIGRYEITNAEYAEFINSTNHPAPPHWKEGTFPPEEANRPVTRVSWDDAKAYADWADLRLPTEMEWEAAARGPRAFRYPWGNEFDTNRANTWESGRGETVDVGSYPDGVSPFGLYDMAGNAAEWVNDDFKPYPDGKSTFQEYQLELKVIRGGSWIFPADYARTTYRYRRHPWEKKEGVGFRVARDAVPIPTPTPIPRPRPKAQPFPLGSGQETGNTIGP